jgi:hypothetical protein
MQEENVKIAEMVLHSFIADPLIKRVLDPKSVSEIIRMHGLTRRELKEARKRQGVKTISNGGSHLWILPEVPQ